MDGAKPGSTGRNTAAVRFRRFYFDGACTIRPAADGFAEPAA